MKRLLLPLLLMLTVAAAAQDISGAHGIAVPNDTTTGTVLHQIAVIKNGTAITPLVTDTTLTPYICILNCGTNGVASLAVLGTTTCVMDPTSPAPSTLGSFFVVMSTTIMGNCHATTVFPTTPTGYAGSLINTSTASIVVVNPLVVGSSSGGGSGTITGVTAGTGLTGGGTSGTVTLTVANPSPAGAVSYNVGGTYLTSAVQTYPCDASNCALDLPLISSPPCCSEPAGIVYILQAALTSGLSHWGFYDGVNNVVDLNTSDTPCDMNNGCTGTAGSNTVLAQAPTLFGKPYLADFTASSGTYAAITGDMVSIGPGLGRVITGSVTSGVFQGCGVKGCNAQPGENLIQEITLAAAVLTGPAPTASKPLFVLNSVTGSPDNNSAHHWVGQTSGAKYSPSTTPAIPYMQTTPAAGFILLGYGSDDKFKIGEGGGDQALYSATQTINGGSTTTNGTIINAGTSQAQPAITITGATTGDVALCSLNTATPASWQTGIVPLLPVVTANTVTFWLSNPTAGNITPTATGVRCKVVR